MTANAPDAVRNLVIAAQEVGERLDRVLASHIPDLSRSRLKTLVLAGQVTVDGTPVLDPGRTVRAATRSHRGAAAGAGSAASRSRSRSASFTRTTRSSSSTSRRGWSCIPAAGNWTGTLVNALVAHCGDSLSGNRWRAPSGYRAPARQGHHRAPGGGEDGSRPSQARGPICGSWPHRRRSNADISRSSGACRRAQRDDRPADRPPPACPRQDGGSCRRAEAITHWEVLERYPRPTKPARRCKPAGMPARDRADPSDPGPSGLDRPSAAG